MFSISTYMAKRIVSYIGQFKKSMSETKTQIDFSITVHFLLFPNIHSFHG